MTVTGTARRRAALLALLLVAGCARVPPASPPSLPHTDVHVLYAPPAADVRLETHGRLRPQYRAAGINGAPMPYDNAVDSSLIICAALGPLFGACAGVLIGGLAVAGITESVVADLSAPGSAREDGDAVRQVFAPNRDYATALGERMAAASIAALTAAGDRAAAGQSCASDVQGLAPTTLTALDVVQLDVEFEPGFRYRLVLVSRLRSSDCRQGAAAAERRVAWRGRPVQLSRDPATARSDFEAEIDSAVASLGADIAAILAGRPRPSRRQY